MLEVVDFLMPVSAVTVLVYAPRDGYVIASSGEITDPYKKEMNIDYYLAFNVFGQPTAWRRLFHRYKQMAFHLCLEKDQILIKSIISWAHTGALVSQNMLCSREFSVAKPAWRYIHSMSHFTCRRFQE